MGLTLTMTHIDHFYYTHLCAPLIFMFNLSAFCIQVILNFREIDKHINQNILGQIHIFTLVNLPPYVCFFVRFQVDISILLMSMLTPSLVKMSADIALKLDIIILQMLSKLMQHYKSWPTIYLCK